MIAVVVWNIARRIAYVKSVSVNLPSFRRWKQRRNLSLPASPSWKRERSSGPRKRPRRTSRMANKPPSRIFFKWSWKILMKKSSPILICLIGGLWSACFPLKSLWRLLHFGKSVFCCHKSGFACCCCYFLLSHCLRAASISLVTRLARCLLWFHCDSRLSLQRERKTSQCLENQGIDSFFRFDPLK